MDFLGRFYCLCFFVELPDPTVWFKDLEMFILEKLQGELKTMVWNKRHCHKLIWIVSSRSKRGQLLEAKCAEENTL